MVGRIHTIPNQPTYTYKNILKIVVLASDR